MTQGNFLQLVQQKIDTNKDLDQQIKKKEEELEEVVEELPLRLLQQSKEDISKLSDGILNLIDKKNSIKEQIESLVSN